MTTQRAGGWRDPGVFPAYRHPAYRATAERAPVHDPVAIPLTLSERTGPGPEVARRFDDLVDLTRHDGGEAIGERIIVTGRVLDEHGDAVADTVVELWQANAAGRYRHGGDEHPAPLDPHFLGAGRCHTQPDGTYRFTTVRPGAYPWPNHPNAWRPAHLHFSVFGPDLTSRLVTQMYFPGDPLHALDPIMAAVPPRARGRMVATYDHAVTQEAWALGYRFDIVLRGARATPAEPDAA